MVFLNALQSMMSIVLVCLVGYVLAWKGWITTVSYTHLTLPTKA